MIIGLDLGTTSISAVLFDPEQCVALCSAEIDETRAVVGNAEHRNPLLVKALEEQFDLPCRVVGSGGEAALGVARLAAHTTREKPPCI